MYVYCDICLEGIFPNCVLRIISINKYRMPCSISENIAHFSTNTRRKTFSLFIYSTDEKHFNNNKNNKNNKIKKQQKTKRKIADHFLFRCFTYGVFGYPDVPFIRYIYLVVWYLSPSRGRIFWKIEHESLCVDCVLVFIVTFKRITTVDWITDILWRAI